MEDSYRKMYAPMRREPKRHYPQAAKFYFQSHQLQSVPQQALLLKGLPAFNRGYNKDTDTVSLSLVTSSMAKCLTSIKGQKRPLVGGEGSNLLCSLDQP